MFPAKIAKTKLFYTQFDSSEVLRMKYADMADWTEEQLKKEVVRLSKECEKKQNTISDLKDKLDSANAHIMALTNEMDTKRALVAYMGVENIQNDSFKDVDYEKRHQDDCIRINELATTIDILVDRYANLRKNKGMC